jgi:uncharacterized membrane protein YeaQ/YmgE (transglycosylase-associated protein family)
LSAKEKGKTKARSESSKLYNVKEVIITMAGILVLIALVVGVLVVGSLVLHLAFSLLGWLLIGLIAGFLANMFMKNGRGGDLIYNLGLGLLGSLLGGFLLNLVGLGRLDNNLIGSVVFSTLGAMLLVWLGRLFTSNKRSINTPPRW